MVCQDTRLLFHLAIRPVWMPCPERSVVILGRKAVSTYERLCRGGWHTSVWLTGTALFTILPIVLAFWRIASSASRASFRFASTCASMVLFSARRSSAFSFACGRSNQSDYRAVNVTSNARAFFLRPICFCSAFDCLLKPLASKSTVREERKNHL
jgi:hypothetical protein